MSRRYEVIENAPLRIEFIIDEKEFHFVDTVPVPSVVEGRFEFHFSPHTIEKTVEWNQGSEPDW